MNTVMIDEALVEIYPLLRQEGWKIVSTHQHVINIMPNAMPDDLLALTDDSLPFFPRQIRFSSLSRPYLLPENFSHTFSCRLTVPNSEFLNQEGIALAWALLAQAHCPTDDVMIMAIQQRLQQSISALLAGLEKDEIAEEALIGLIGLGLGLTPSGDDFLCGLLSALHLPISPYHHLQEALVQSVQTYLSQTHLISSAFLKDACMAQIGAPLQALINTLFQVNRQLSEIEMAIHQLTALGHRSGYDLLSGFLAGLPHSQHRRISLCPNIVV